MTKREPAANYLLRKLTPLDLDAFIAVRLRSLEESPSAYGKSDEEWRALSHEFIEEKLSDPDNSFVLGAFERVAGGENLIGISGFRRMPGERTGHKGYIWGVFIIPECRGKGLGRKLLVQTISDGMQIKGIEQLTLTVSESQAAAQKLYESLGFIRYGTEPRALRFGDQYFDEHLMYLRPSTD